MFFESIILLVCTYPSYGLHCDSSDFKYEYTECDSRGERWRVAVPLPGKDCTGLPEPQRGINCSFSCSAGHYLDVDTQICRPCAAGRYSLGGGIRFEEFVTLPHGFSVENFDAESDVVSQTSQKRTQACPPETGWVVRDGELLYVPTPCISRLSFSASLVRPGFAVFGYRMPKNNRALSLQIDVRNEQCQSYKDALQSMIAKYAAGARSSSKEQSNGDWTRRKIELKTGPNVISWTVTNSFGVQAPGEPIRVSHIDILGLAFTRECTLCPAGTFSASGASECTICEPGYYSSKGSETCGKCPLSQYSGPKASHCIDRPPCRTSDYYPVMEPCTNGTTRTTYKKVQPAVCREDLPNSAKAPPASPSHPCPKCNPGMAKNKLGICEFCKKDFFSDGNSCSRCPVDTEPNYGYQYTNWEVLPPHIETRCEYISEDVFSQCDIGDAWLASGSALISAPSLQRGIALEMIISVPEGFNNPLAPHDSTILRTPEAQLTIVFEITCADSSCVLYFIEDTAPETPKNSQYRFLAVFNGTQPRHVWSHSITKRSPARFMVAFLRSGASSGEDNISDKARILSVNITNIGELKGVQGGGASQCLPCPKGINGGCVPCPLGHYMHEQTHACTQCPVNSMLNTSSDRVGPKSCIPCGTNLISKDGTACRSDGHFKIENENKTMEFNLGPWVNRTWETHGVKVFSREGSSYYHSFNISLFGPTVQCREHFDESIQVTFSQPAFEVVEGAACRVTALPDSGSNHSDQTMASPLLLATRLESISTERNHNRWSLTDQALEYDGVDVKNLPIDVHLWFDTVGIPSEACPRGNSFVVTTRCSPAHKKPQVRLPRSCPDGTCDGCLFHVIVEAAQACPVCNPGDNQQIKGECLNGKQTIHFIPDKHCLLSGAAAAPHEEACSVLTSTERGLLVAGATTLMLLSLTLIMIYKRNRRLEYKYTRLIESRTGELPVAESCGLEDEEEEEDQVMFKKGKRSLFGGGGRGTSQDRAAFVPLENED